MSMNPLRRHSGDETVRRDEVRDSGNVVRDEVHDVRSERDSSGSSRVDTTRITERDRVPSDDDGRDHVASGDVHPTRPLRRREARERDRTVDDETPALDRATVVAREKEAFGGLKVGSAFFGWLAAVGTAVLLTALLAAVITAVRVAGGQQATTDPATIVAGSGLRTDVAIIVILFVAYYCGGYVAGRMARFNGLTQGLAVWVWAVVAALLITAVGAVAGARWDLLGSLNGFPRLQASGAPAITSGSVVTTLLALVAALVGAVLGGLAGMRFHRRVDRAGLGR